MLNKALQNFCVLVTRPEAQGVGLCKAVLAAGGEVLHFPTIAFAPPNNEPKFHQAITQLGQQDWVIFISPQAVAASISIIKKQWPRLPTALKIAAVGEGTAKALQAAGFSNVLYPQGKWNSEEVLALPVFQQVKNQKIAIVRGEGGRELLDSEFAMRGATVLPIIAYQRVLPAVDTKPYQTLLNQGKIHAAVAASFEAAQNLKTLLGTAICSIPLVVVSDRIKTLVQNLHYQVIRVSQNASDHAILEVLVSIRKEHD